MKRDAYPGDSASIFNLASQLERATYVGGDELQNNSLNLQGMDDPSLDISHLTFSERS